MSRLRVACSCPDRCLYCGARRRRDPVGHYCPSKNCQWSHGYAGCTLHIRPKGPGKGNHRTHHSPKQIAARKRFPPTVVRRSEPVPDSCFEQLPAARATQRISLRHKRRS